MERQDLDSQAHLRLLRRILRKRWKLMLAVFLGLAIPIAAYTLFFEKKTYEAMATLFVDSSPEKYSFLKEWIPGSDIPLQMAVLKSRALAELVVASLPRESVDELLNEAMYRDYLLELGNWFRKLTDRELVVYSPKERAVLELQKARMSFTVSARSSQVEIGAVATRPRVAMDLANTYVEILLARSRSFVREEARAAREFLEQQFTQVQETLKEHEEQLAQFRLASGEFQVARRSDLELSRLAQAEASLAEVQLSKEFAKSRLASLRAHMEKGGQASVQGPRLKERRAQLEDRLSGLLERYTEQHPMVIATRAEIREVQKKLEALPAETQGAPLPLLSGVNVEKQVADLEQEIAALKTKEEMLQNRVATIRRSLAGRGAEELEHTRLQRTVQSQRNFTSLLMDKLTAARIREQGDDKSLRVIDLASLPMAPSGARTSKKLAVGLLLSLALSVGLGGLLEFFKDPVETEDDIRQATGLSVLGYLPAVDAKSLQNGTASSPLNLWEQPTWPILFADRCRGMALLLQAIARDRPLRSLMVASAVPEEGKSTVLVSLAWACAEMGKRLLLVDSDLRRPALSKTLHLPDGPGLTDLLSGQADGDQLFVPLGDRVHVLRSGNSHPAPYSLLTPEAAAWLVPQLQSRADVVLFDSPPLGPFPDNFHLAALVDGVIVVARAGESRKRDLTRIKEELERFGARTLGVVLNGLSPSAIRQYYGKYYAHYEQTTPRAGWVRRLQWPRADGKIRPVRFRLGRKRRDP